MTCSVIPSTSESVHSNHKDVHDRLLLMIMMLRNIRQTGLENTLDHLYKLIHLLTELFINITGAHDSSVTIKKGNVFPETNKRQFFVQKRSGIWPQRTKAWKNENSGTSAFLDLIYWKRSNSHLVSFLAFPSKVTQNYDNEERSAIHRLNTTENFGCDLMARKLKPCGGQQGKTTSPEKNFNGYEIGQKSAGYQEPSLIWLARVTINPLQSKILF